MICSLQKLYERLYFKELRGSGIQWEGLNITIACKFGVSILYYADILIYIYTVYKYILCVCLYVCMNTKKNILVTMVTARHNT